MGSDRLPAEAFGFCVRDTRFSADKTPYKTYQGMFVPRVLGTGCYLQISADGGQAAAGFTATGPTACAVA